MPKHLLLIIVCFFLWGMPWGVAAQKKPQTDSLIRELSRVPPKDTVRMRLLTAITSSLYNPQEKLRYASMLLDQALDTSNPYYLHHAYLHQGIAYRVQGDFEVAVYALLKSYNYAEQIGYAVGKASSNKALADAYAYIGNHANALLHYGQALGNLKDENPQLCAEIMLGMGDEFFQYQLFDSALLYFEKSNRIFHKTQGDGSIGELYSRASMALAQSAMGQTQKADPVLADVLDHFSSSGNYYEYAAVTGYLSGTYQRLGLDDRAGEMSDSSFRYSRLAGLKIPVVQNLPRLSDLYVLRQLDGSAQQWHLRQVQLKDSLASDEILARIENLESAFALARKQGEVDLLMAQQRTQRILLITAVLVALVVSVLLIIILNFYRQKERSNRLLAEQKQALEALNATRDKLMSIVSHDLRGPISAFHGIPGIIEYAIETQDKEEIAELTGLIEDSVNQMSSLLDNLLGWTLQQQGQFPYTPERLEAQELVHNTVNTLANMARGKNISLKAEVGETLAVYGDKNTIMTILRNLVNNALKYTREGGKVWVSASQELPFCKIEVGDTGIGMPAENVQRLMSGKEARSTYGTSGEKGVGLGLQLVAEFVEMNQGRLHVSSEAGKGTVFTVWLPLAG